MNNSLETHQFWLSFCAENPAVDPAAPYEVWHFDHRPETTNKLVNYVLEGRKKATASLMEHESDIGQGGIVGGHSVVTDFEGNPMCVIRTTEVHQVPFNEVDAQFAFDEGEGDKSLEYWRQAHTRFFTECCKGSDLEFNESMMVCCKRFVKVFP